MRLPAATFSDTVVIRVAPGDTGLFRYVLEGAGGHLAMLTVLDPKAATFRLLFSPHQSGELFEMLESMRSAVSFEILPLSS